MLRNAARTAFVHGHSFDAVGRDVAEGWFMDHFTDYACCPSDVLAEIRQALDSIPEGPLGSIYADASCAEAVRCARQQIMVEIRG
ncbi:hypothetical protein BKE38_22445 [Pseudoroseomonas deserti]|uniref:Uncharacterized protein n=1 Tax=Teichococcus deserti TaxID=1817963 RepID=A0A1V2GWS6_9PROT|nr:hypothetical protein BKE38_22445 [Pseudoroseomonas deserti]